MSGPLPVRHIQTGNSQRGLQRISPHLSSSSPLSSPRQLGVFAKSHPIPEEAELAGQEADGEGATGQRDAQHGDQSRAR